MRRRGLLQRAAGIAVIAMAAVSGATSGPVAAPPPPESRWFWVLQPPDQLVRYGLSDFARHESVGIPPAAFTNPEERLVVGGDGRLLATLEDDRAWCWDGHAVEIVGAPAEVEPPAGFESHPSVQWFLAADGHHLVLAENLALVEMDPSGLERTTTTRFRVERIGLAHEPPQLVFEHSFPPCSCGTGTCTETCPQGSAWVPGGIVGDGFLWTQVVPGQLGAEYGPSHMVRLVGGRSKSTEIPTTGEQFLDAIDSAAARVEVTADGGCCGWSNEGNDRTWWIRRGKSEVIFDERDRYHNANYDVSFYTSNTRMAPDGERVAFTIRSTSGPEEELRVSSDGHPDSLELARIRKTLATMPMVEVQGPGAPSKPLLQIPHADLIGWSSDSEILVLESGSVVALDVRTGNRRVSTIRAGNASEVFLPRP